MFCSVARPERINGRKDTERNGIVGEERTFRSDRLTGVSGRLIQITGGSNLDEIPPRFVRDANGDIYSCFGNFSTF